LRPNGPGSTASPTVTPDGDAPVYVVGPAAVDLDAPVDRHRQDRQPRH
jgi:hypothetical protein